LPDSPKIWNSTDALNLELIPKKLLVIGGGYIGLELGSVYASLGSKVTVVEMTKGLLPGADRDMVRVLQRSLENKFESILLNTKVSDITETKDGIKVKFEGSDNSSEETFDRVLVSVGRRPVTEGLGLENTNVQISDRGFVLIDEKCQTNDPSIFAIGDIVGGAMLAHKASAEGKVAVDAIMGKKVAFEPNAIPAVVFTDPELAWAGLNETEAKKKGIKVEVARFPWGASGRATTIDRNDGLTKLLIDPETERIVGMGLVGAGAGEMISEGVLAIEMAALAKDVALSIHPHPTLSETVMEASEVFFGHSTHLYRPKRK
jgi:dihydrolipoamide dehydrogenase